MKLVYSHFKKLIPELDQPINKISDDLTLVGHMAEEIEEKDETKIINLEIAKNRGDCLGYYGLAKDLAVFYDLKLKLAEIPEMKFPDNKEVDITVSAKKEVLRLMAVEIKNLTNLPSPKWLKSFLKMHQINSINTLVDLTNYIMLIYGIPCHAFDAKKISHQLEWKIGEQRGQITTLDGTKIDIEKGDFYISDPSGAASLPAIGGSRTAIDLDTKEILIEMAIYDPLKVRLDAKKMNVRTEASIRLEKDLDTELIPLSFKHLTSLITDLCGGKPNTKIFDYYPKKSKPKIIAYDPHKPSDFAGIDIPAKKGLRILERLGCQLNQSNRENIKVTPPSLRKDLNLEEDLIEEVIRFYGYDRIPTDQPVSSKSFTDITPKVIKLKQAVKNQLANFGYDEIRSWPIIKEKDLHKSKILPENSQPIYTENNVNSEYPLLRMSIASSLYLQTIQSDKLKLPDKNFFEVGKVYYQENNNYLEDYTVSFYQPDFNRLESDAKKLVSKLGVENYQYSIEKIKNKKFIEINLDDLVKILPEIPKISLNSPNVQMGKAIELTSQIIDLDANVVLDKEVCPKKLIKKYQEKIRPGHFWKLEIIDIYPTKSNQFRYTFRAYYYNLSTQKAKKLHFEIFNLK